MAIKNDINSEIQRKIGSQRLFYVCRDTERAAAGLLLGLPNFYILTNDGPYARELAKKYAGKIFIVKNKKQLDTHELLLNKIIDSGDWVMIFKPTTKIEKICAERGWKLLNPPAVLAAQVEEKISQVKWLGALAKKYLPPHKIDILKNIKFSGEPFILQFNYGHTGSGTMLIKSKKQWADLIKQFPDRPARATKFIEGPMFTNNNIVWGDKILLGNISYQITGLKPFTNNKFATVGNDWTVPRKILNKNQIAQYHKIANDIGKKLARSGWRGLFGIDVIQDEKTGKMYLVEINARQPASTTFESELQNLKKGLTTFTAHLAALLGVKYHDEKLTEINDGAQIIERVGSKIKHAPKNTWRVIKYKNTKPGEDKNRYQFLHGIMIGRNQIKI